MVKVTKPLIGITLDWEKEGSFSTRPHYALRTHYFDAVERAGGLPVGIPYNEDLREDYLNLVDGILIPGGTMAKPMEWYEEGTGKLPYPEMPRCDSDIWFTEQCIARNIPFLGICEGMQVLAGVLGCKLTADVQKSFNTDLKHHNSPQTEERVHDVTIIDRTLLASILRTDKLKTNTLHREGVREISDHAIVCAKAEDGVIEAIEAHPEMGHTFALGIEWHPEYFAKEGEPDFNILTAFVRACHG